MKAFLMTLFIIAFGPNARSVEKELVEFLLRSPLLADRESFIEIRCEIRHAEEGAVLDVYFSDFQSTYVYTNVFVERKFDAKDKIILQLRVFKGIRDSPEKTPTDDVSIVLLPHKRGPFQHKWSMPVPRSLKKEIVEVYLLDDNGAMRLPLK
jgi:hypothetical protein